MLGRCESLLVIRSHPGPTSLRFPSAARTPLYSPGEPTSGCQTTASNLSPGGASPESRRRREALSRALLAAAFTCSSSQAAWLQNNSGSQTSPPWGKLRNAGEVQSSPHPPTKAAELNAPQANLRLRGSPRGTQAWEEGPGCPQMPWGGGCSLQRDFFREFSYLGEQRGRAKEREGVQGGLSASWSLYLLFRVLLWPQGGGAVASSLAVVASGA